MKKFLFVPMLLLSLTALAQTYQNVSPGIKFNDYTFIRTTAAGDENIFPNITYPFVFETLKHGSFEFINHFDERLLSIHGNTGIKFFKNVEFLDNRLVLGELKTDLLTFNTDQLLIRKYNSEYEFGTEHSRYPFVFQTLSNGSFDFISHTNERLASIDGYNEAEFYKGIIVDKGIYGRDDASTTKFRINPNGDSYFNGGKVGIGNNTPDYELDVNGDINFTGSLRIGDQHAFTYLNNNIFLGQESGAASITGDQNVFVGRYTGNSITSGSQNVFLGQLSGQYTTEGGNNTFIGNRAGENAQGITNNIASNNTYIGNYAGHSAASNRNENTGSNNTFIGSYAGEKNTSGSKNIFIGYQTGQNNTTANDNILIGYKAGLKHATNNGNLFIGNSAGEENASGLDNVMLGNLAGKNNKGSGNVFLGASAGIADEDGNNKLYIANKTGIPLVYGEFDNELVGINTSTPGYTLDVNGDINLTGELLINGNSILNNNVEDSTTIFGYEAGNANSGKYNTIFGFQAGSGNLGQENVFVGHWTGKSSEGNNNTFIGTRAGFDSNGSGNFYMGLGSGMVTEGSQNMFMGYAAGSNYKDGDFNVFLGYRAGYKSDLGGNNNVFIGSSSGDSFISGTDNLFLGTSSGAYAQGSSNVFIGKSSGKFNNASKNLFIGEEAGQGIQPIGDDPNTNTGEFNTLIGHHAGKDNSTGNNNTMLGYQAGMTSNGNGNILIGQSAGKSMEGNYNFALGYAAGANYKNGNYNTFLGYRAGYSKTDASSTNDQYNTFIGSLAGDSLVSGSNNVFLGMMSGKKAKGDNNVFIGKESGKFNHGSTNLFIGNNAGAGIEPAVGETNGNIGVFNTFIGHSSGDQISSGNYNTYLGSSSGKMNQTGDRNVFLGFQAGYAETGSNKLYIANATETALIYGEFDNKKVGINTTNPGATLHVKSENTGNESWIAQKLEASTSNTVSSTPNAQYFVDNNLLLDGNQAFTNVIGLHNRIAVKNTSLSNKVRSLYGRVDMIENGQADKVSLLTTHFQGDENSSSTSKINEVYGLAIGGDGSGASRFTSHYTEIGNTYGVYIDDITNGNQTGDKFGIYVKDADADNYFAGKVGIGKSEADYELDVNGTINASSILINGEAITAGSQAWNLENDIAHSAKQVTIGDFTDIENKTPDGYNLYVRKGILAERVRVAVATTTDWADYVFDKNYKLKSLSDVEKFIIKNKHLPDVPSAKEVVEKGVDMAKMDATLLQKIEELTLYMIKLEKRNKALEERVKELEKE